MAASLGAANEVREGQTLQTERQNLDSQTLIWSESSLQQRPSTYNLTNEDWWILVRRFNKQMFHVKRLETKSRTNLDLNIASEEFLSPEKLQMHLERFYVTLAVSTLSAFSHVARLRSWKEKKRTFLFFLTYTVAWLLNCLCSVVIASTVILIVYPPSRGWCFPSAPISIVNIKDGQFQRPFSGQLASATSMTGTPEKYRGEALEQEALCFLKSIVEVSW